MVICKSIVLEIPQTALLCISAFHQIKTTIRSWWRGICADKCGAGIRDCCAIKGSSGADSPRFTIKQPHGAVLFYAQRPHGFESLFEKHEKENSTIRSYGAIFFGGETGIRTLETLPRLHDFQSCAFDQLSHLSIACYELFSQTALL